MGSEHRGASLQPIAEFSHARSDFLVPRLEVLAGSYQSIGSDAQVLARSHRKLGSTAVIADVTLRTLDVLEEMHAKANAWADG